MTTFSMVTCFVCTKEFWTEKRDKTTKANSNPDSNSKEEEEDEEDWILFCKCLNVPQIEIDEYKKHLCNKSKLEEKERIGTDTGLFSLCPRCSVVKGKILILYEQLESIQFKLKEISNQLTNTIKNTQEKNNKSKNKNNKNSINTRKSGRGQNNTYSNEGIQRLRQTICDQTKSTEVPKSKKSVENSPLLPVHSEAIKTKEKEREEEREQFDVEDEGNDFLSSNNIKQEVESESEGDYENPENPSPLNQEEEENDKDAPAEDEKDHPDFFYGIYEFLSTSIVDVNRNTNPEQNQNQNLNENENDSPSPENNPDSEAGAKIMDKPPPRKRRKFQVPEEWIANIQKRKRMLGEEYLMLHREKNPDGSMKYSRHLKAARIMKTRCRCSRGHPNVGKARACGQIGEEDRQTIFHKFWKQMDWDEKKLWVKSAVVVTRPKRPKNMVKKKKKKKKKPGKRKRKGEEDSNSDSNSSSSDSADEINQNVNVNPIVEKYKKEVTVKYFLPLRDHRRIAVCKSMFLSTLGIENGSLHGWLKESTASLKKKE